MEDTYASTKRFYDNNAESYAEATRALPVSDLVDSFIRQLPIGAGVVDLGCGAGRDLLNFALKRVSAIGVDISEPLIRIARENSNCPVVLGDLRALPFGNYTFGGAWASASLLHFRRSDVDSALAEVRRVLCQNGIFFSSIKCGRGQEMDANGRWFSYFDELDWLAHLSRAGFSVIETQSSIQKSGTLEKDRAVSWFSCISKMENH
jgi:SAM-dependent methyltransferase